MDHLSKRVAAVLQPHLGCIIVWMCQHLYPNQPRHAQQLHFSLPFHMEVNPWKHMPLHLQATEAEQAQLSSADITESAELCSVSLVNHAS